MPMITEVNGNINKAFPWVFLFIPLCLIHMVIHILSAVVHTERKGNCRWESWPTCGFSHGASHRLDLIKQNKQIFSASCQKNWASIPRNVFIYSIYPQGNFKSTVQLPTFPAPTLPSLPHSSTLPWHPPSAVSRKQQWNRLRTKWTTVRG